MENGRYHKMKYQRASRLTCSLTIERPGLLPGQAPYGTGVISGAAPIDNNSTSKTSVEFGPIGPEPASPYPSDEGIKTCHLDPTGIIGTTSCQAGMT